MIDPHRILDAALTGNSEHLRELAAEAGTSLRRTLYAAGAVMMNALAVEEIHHDKMRRLARAVDADRMTVLRGAPHAWAHAGYDGAAKWLLDNRLMNTDGELSADGRLVLALAEMDAKLTAQVRDRALSDEDVTHE